MTIHCAKSSHLALNNESYQQNLPEVEICQKFNPFSTYDIANEFHGLAFSFLANVLVLVLVLAKGQGVKHETRELRATQEKLDSHARVLPGV